MIVPYIYAAKPNIAFALTSRRPSMSWLDGSKPEELRNFHFRDHIRRVKKTANFYQTRLNGMLGRKSKLSLRNKRTIYLMCIGTMMTYASPVFAYAIPTTLKKLQVISPKLWTAPASGCQMGPTRVGVPVTSCAKRTPLRDPLQGESRAVNTLVCFPAALGQSEWSPS
ncbi:hypothetical protein EVAR_61777_1 [Eumeta japonica]|uniref:Uncharacterized protein n=1 Tax=Eumeta variegata TaxID=151549 RepID=A0A4C1Z3E9_EUMVA|nr:hypothetical protein EVAR_61777_1 [Eumeta japonica]